MTLTIELPERQQAALAARAREHGVSAEEYARRVLAHDLEASLKPRRHIWDVIAEHMTDVPPDDLAAMPRDGASRIDHYVYGLPRRTS